MIVDTRLRLSTCANGQAGFPVKGRPAIPRHVDQCRQTPSTSLTSESANSWLITHLWLSEVREQ